MKRTVRRLLPLLLLSSHLFAAEPVKIELAGIENAHRLTPTLLSGGQPEGEAAFAALQAAGVKSIISVDGAPTDVETAKKFGLRYVHVPVSYGGIGQPQTAALIKAGRELPGPVFVHCHHGKHRGVAAAALIARDREGWTAEQASAFLKQAGTAPDYPGLYACVKNFTPPSAPALAAVRELPELAKVDKLADAMVHIDHAFDRLKENANAADALILLEEFRELNRLKAGPFDQPEYVRLSTEAEQHAAAYHASFAQPVADRTALRKAIEQNCKACHKAFRN
jgi:protein tyrosine phosphatase (PTP) superfamily phosphohydrolase (DUF442 family)